MAKPATAQIITVVMKYIINRNTCAQRTEPLFWAVPAPVIDATVVKEDDSGTCSMNDPTSSSIAEVLDAMAECRGSSTLIRRVSV